MRDGSRNVGAVYAIDKWTLKPGLQVSYGGKYARYDYLEDRGLISPARDDDHPARLERLSQGADERDASRGRTGR